MQYVGFDVHKPYTFYTQMDTPGQIQCQGKPENIRALAADEDDVRVYHHCDQAGQGGGAGRLCRSSPL